MIFISTNLSFQKNLITMEVLYAHPTSWKHAVTYLDMGDSCLIPTSLSCPLVKATNLGGNSYIWTAPFNRTLLTQTEECWWGWWDYEGWQWSVKDYAVVILHMCVRVYTYMCVCMCVYVYVFFLYIYLCIYCVCVCVCVYIYIYIYIYHHGMLSAWILLTLSLTIHPSILVIALVMSSRLHPVSSEHWWM